MALERLAQSEDAFADGPFGSNLKTEHYSASGARVVRLQNIGRGVFLGQDAAFIPLDHFSNLRRHEVLPRDVVVAALGDGARPAGRACIIPDDLGPALVKADCFRVRVPPDVLFPPYLVSMLNSPQSLTAISGMMRGATRPRVTLKMLRMIEIPLPAMDEQRRIAKSAAEAASAADRAHAAAEEQRRALDALLNALLRGSFEGSGRSRLSLSSCLVEVTHGVGSDALQYPLLGATRAGIAPAKEGFGKHSERYKLVEPGTIFYNPMRILLGSIAMVDHGDDVGVTSPDYVVFKTKHGVLDSRWFYFWLRSTEGETFIKSLARGAVRERMLFRRLASASVELPAWETQVATSENLERLVRLRDSVGAQLSALDALPAALLRRAFSGEL